MLKDRGLNPLASNQGRASPRACCANDSNSSKLGTSSPPLAESEWEDARCPICMEHPHNAVLLICSSHKKGCHPYMCDTSYRHSNCLDQFRKSFPGMEPSGQANDETVTRMHNDSERARGRGRQRSPESNRPLGGQGVELVCPLCRGQIIGWDVVKAPRMYMNSKVRSCSLESCEFTGNYAELRKHARHEHPSLRPSEADPERQSDWVRLERQRDLGDTLSAYQSQFVPDLNGDDLPWSDIYQDDDVILDVPSEGGNLFDHFFNGIDSEAEDEHSEDGNSLGDLSYEIEFSFSYLSNLSMCPWDDDGGTTRSSGGLYNNRRSTEPRTRSINHRETSSPRRRRSRHTPYLSPRRGVDGGR